MVQSETDVLVFKVLLLHVALSSWQNYVSLQPLSTKLIIDSEIGIFIYFKLHLIRADEKARSEKD